MGSPIPNNTIDKPMTHQIDTSPSRQAVVDILSEFANLKSGFTLPATLDFLPLPGAVSAPAPKLAYTPTNAPLHQYEDLLTGLLTKLDAVRSYGDVEVRKARKEAVKKIQSELEKQDAQKVDEWRRQSQSKATVVEPISEPNHNTCTTQSMTHMTEEAQQPPAPANPTSVPLPHDEDRESHKVDSSEPPTTFSTPAVPDLSSAEPSPPQPHGDSNPRHPAAPSELTEPVVSPVPPSLSTLAAEPIQEEPMHESTVTKPTLEPVSTGQDAAEDDFVHITSVEKVGDLNPVGEGSEGDDTKIRDDWDLSF
ncbi:hypothetical protein FRC09_003075 [Ceratobasidium sp. 395]|nr:hypothetical protein FRC09_003075 [Ceratobasidium sp. 395]